MRRVQRGLLGFGARAAVLAALLAGISRAARPQPAPPPEPRAPEVPLEIDPAWGDEVDRHLDLGDAAWLTARASMALPVLIDRLLHRERGAPASLALERILEARGVIDEDGRPLRVRHRSAEHRDTLAAWYLENRERIEGAWTAPVEADPPARRP